jgi:hypothetical protein
MSEQFRITSVAFDDAEEVESVTAVASPACMDFIRAHAPSVHAEEAAHLGRGLAMVTLSREDVLHVHAMAGKVRGTDLEHAGSSPVYGSFCMVIYGLME